MPLGFADAIFGGRKATTGNASAVRRLDKGLSALVQDDQNTRFLCTTNYRINHIIQRFYKDNIIGDELLLSFVAKFQR